MDQESNELKLTEKEQNILGVIYSVELNPKDSETNEFIVNDRRIKLDSESIFSVSRPRIGEDRILFDSMLKSLLERKLVKVDANVYSLTEFGRKIGLITRSKWQSKFYDKLLLRCAESAAYAKFCERVYGKNLLQFNVVDMQNLDLMLEKLEIKSSDKVLDLGCGLGKITEYIAEETKAEITAIDFSEKSIRWAKANANGSEKIKFEVMDINDLNYPSESFDKIIALDVLYWIDELETVIKKLKMILKPEGRLAFFYVNFQDKENKNKPFNWENSKISNLLEQNNFSYEVVDISQNAIDLWERKLKVGKELQEEFLSENNVDIIDSRLADGLKVIKKFEVEEQKRYICFVKHKNSDQ